MHSSAGRSILTPLPQIYSVRCVKQVLTSGMFTSWKQVQRVCVTRIMKYIYWFLLSMLNQVASIAEKYLTMRRKHVLQFFFQRPGLCMKQSVFLQANGLAFPYVSDILKHRRWNDKETLLQFMMGSTSYARIQNFSLGSGLEQGVVILLMKSWSRIYIHRQSVSDCKLKNNLLILKWNWQLAQPI